MWSLILVSCSLSNIFLQLQETFRSDKMIGLGHLSLALLAMAGVLAAPTADLDAPDFMLGPHNLERRQDYNQNYRTGGSVNFSPASNGYSVSFSGAGDFVVGKGWKTGTTRWDSDDSPSTLLILTMYV
jgi:endo-1,4-beta-xylanase